MAYQNPKTKYILIVMAISFAIIKLFTAVLMLEDDPSNFLVFKISPSFDTQVLVSSVDEEKYIILLSDENGFIGENFYYLVTVYLWWLTPILTVVFILVSARQKNT